MQVFKSFFKIAKKRIPSIAIYLVIFLVLTFLLSGSSKKESANNFESKKIDITIIDQDETVASHSLTDYLDSMHNLVKIKNDRESQVDALYYRTTNYILTIPKGYEQSLEKNETKHIIKNLKLPNSNKSQYIEQQINTYLTTVHLYKTSGYALDDALSKGSDAAKAEVKVTMNTYKSDQKADQNLYYYFQYLPYIFLLVLVCGLSPIVVTFQKANILHRTNCSPLNPKKMNFHLILSCLIYSLVIFLFFIVAAMLIYKKAFFTEYGLLCSFNILVALLNGMLFSLLISLFAPSENATSMIANIFGLGISFLGGIFVPQSLMDSNILAAAHFVPTYWFMRAHNMLSNMSSELYSVSKYFKYIGIQALFGVALLASIVFVSKVKHGQSKSLA